MKLGLPALTLVLVAACGDDGPPPAAVRDAGPVVAEVVGVPIHLADVEHRMVAEHLGVREALDRLIEEELTVQAAKRLGLRPDRDVAFTRKRAAVQLLLQRHVEAQVTTQDVTEAEVRSAWDVAQTREVDHLLVKVSAQSNEAVRQRARALAKRAHERAVATTTREEFVALAAALREPGLEVVHEDLGSFQREGRYVRAFADQAFRLERPGQISEPFETEFGWHIVRLRATGNALGPSLEEARSKIVDSIVRAKRRAALERLVGEIAARHRVEVDDAVLDLLGPGG